MPRGGPRPGSGRKKGTKDRRPRATHRTERALNARDEMLDQARAEAMELPVPRLLRRLNDPSLSEEYRDKLAVAVAPYCQSEIKCVGNSKAAEPMDRPGAFTSAWSN